MEQLPRRSLAARMADRKRRARLTAADRAASVSLTEAQVEGTIENVRPLMKGDRLFFRVEAVVEASRVDALLGALADPDVDDVVSESR